MVEVANAGPTAAPPPPPRGSASPSSRSLGGRRGDFSCLRALPAGQRLAERARDSGDTCAEDRDRPAFLVFNPLDELFIS